MIDLQFVFARLVSSWKTHEFIKLNVRRDYLLGCPVPEPQGAVQAGRFKHIGEKSPDVGRLKQEWFELATKAVFNPDLGLW
ncbi:hypothetical protein ACHAWF_008293 [Thalassiosira exigua]